MFDCKLVLEYTFLSMMKQKFNFMHQKAVTKPKLTCPKGLSEFVKL